MNTIFGTFLQFIYQQMTNYINLTLNTTKDQKINKKGPKEEASVVKYTDQ